MSELKKDKAAENTAEVKTDTKSEKQKKADKPKKEQKPRVVKVSDDKKQLFSEILTNLTEIYGENAKVEKENKLIIVKIGEKTFKIDLIEQRKPKK